MRPPNPQRSFTIDPSPCLPPTINNPTTHNTPAQQQQSSAFAGADAWLLSPPCQPYTRNNKTVRGPLLVRCFVVIQALYVYMSVVRVCL